MSILLKLLRPRTIPQRKSQWDWKIKWYYSKLTRRMSIYRRCAISDTIHIGDIQIVHTIRDYWFEQELQRFHIDVAQHLGKADSPTPSRRPWGLSSLFHWTESFTVYANGKSYTVSHAKTFSIQSDMPGQLKVSTDRDIILRSEYTVKQGRTVASADAPAVSRPRVASEPPEQAQPAPSPQTGRSTRSKITIKDRVPTEPSTTVVPPTPETPPAPPVEEPTQTATQYRGFEENDIF